MTEVPDHLLQRSRERRAALGLLKEGDADTAAAPGAAPADVDPASPAAAVATPPAPAAAAPAVLAPPPPAPPPPPPPPHVAAAQRRPHIPVWAVPVLAGLPLWAFVYVGTLDVPDKGLEDPVLLEGQEVFAAQCSACHGGGGEGGTGRPLTGGDVVLTFADPQQHIAWVADGSPAPGTPYGDPARSGGQRLSQSDGFGAMPGFGDSLSEEEIIAVVRYEREVLSGETEPALASGEGGGGGDGEPTGEAESEGGDADEGGGAGSGG